MGQKVHPYGFRLGVSRTWTAKWYADKDYTSLLKEDIAIRQLVVVDDPFAEAVGAREEVADVRIAEIHDASRQHIGVVSAATVEHRMQGVEVALASARLHGRRQIDDTSAIALADRSPSRPARRLEIQHRP
jgi:hypothetical protein